MQNHGGIDEIGGKKRRRDDGATFDHQPGDAAFGERLQERREIDPALLRWKAKHVGAVPEQHGPGAGLAS